jgi:hypothetical protein
VDIDLHGIQSFREGARPERGASRVLGCMAAERGSDVPGIVPIE